MYPESGCVWVCLTLRPRGRGAVATVLVARFRGQDPGSEMRSFGDYITSAASVLGCTHAGTGTGTGCGYHTAAGNFARMVWHYCIWIVMHLCSSGVETIGCVMEMAASSVQRNECWRKDGCDHHIRLSASHVFATSCSRNESRDRNNYGIGCCVHNYNVIRHAHVCKGVPWLLYIPYIILLLD